MKTEQSSSADSSLVDLIKAPENKLVSLQPWFKMFLFYLR